MNVKEQITEEDVQWLAKTIAMIPALAIPSDTLARLHAHELVTETPGGLNATDKGILTVINWESIG